MHPMREATYSIPMISVATAVDQIEGRILSSFSIPEKYECHVMQAIFLDAIVRRFVCLSSCELENCRGRAGSSSRVNSRLSSGT